MKLGFLLFCVIVIMFAVTYHNDNSTDEFIIMNMFYISDRWNCAFRLKWLIDGITTGKIKV